MKALRLLMLAGFGSAAQQEALLPARDALTLYKRVVNLMESTAIAIPELARAGGPVTENARQSLITLEREVNDHAGLTYRFLVNLRAYVSLADSVPKPFPFPEEARRQLAELRDAQGRAESHFLELLDSKELRLRSPDRDNLRRYREANLKTSAPSAGRPRVVFLGDSITDGWRINEYFPSQDFVNRGIGGQITGEMLGRMKADVIDLKPAAVLILAGTNDLGRGIAVEVIQNNLTMIADLAQANGIKTIIASILPVSDYHKEKDPRFAQTGRRPPETIRELNIWIRAFCQRRGFTYCNYFDSLVDNAGMLKAELADDGLHPNGAGYRVMAPIALAAIESSAKQKR